MEYPIEPVLPEYRLRIVETIKAAGLNPVDFDKKEKETTVRLALKRDPRLYFTFIRSHNSFGNYIYGHTSYTPKRDYVDYGQANSVNFFEALKVFDSWLKEVVFVFLKQQEIPDPWQQIRADNSLLFSDQVFDKETIASLSPKIDEVKYKIQNLNLDPSIQEQLTKFANELTEIKEELKSLKTKSWLRQMTGWAIQLLSFISDKVPAEQVDAVKKIIQEFFDQSIKNSLARQYPSPQNLPEKHERRWGCDLERHGF
jgi:hypothetical protein